MNEVKAVIADDEAPLRQFLRARLSEVWPELVICGEAKNGKEACKKLFPDALWMDYIDPGIT